MKKQILYSVYKAYNILSKFKVIHGKEAIPKCLCDELLCKGMVLLLGELVQILLPGVEYLTTTVWVNLHIIKQSNIGMRPV
jgi:hypothetical protein